MNLIILLFVLIVSNAEPVTDTANSPVDSGIRYSATICDTYYNACQTRGFSSYPELKPGTETCIHFEDNTVRCGFVEYDEQGRWEFVND
jgi:hypothetical protein